ncbi:MAG: hypothetical protein MJE63_26015 [Proteobacteria bacterium]|nr:hypothetical protein [Pseudomonadota bacterium]
MMKVFWVVLLLLLNIPAWAEEPADFPENDLEFSEEAFGFEEEDAELAFDDEGELEPDLENKEQDKPGSFFQEFSAASRFTLKHEASYKTVKPEKTINNRSSFRWEFSKFFGNYFFLQFDTKLNAFWGNDHRAEAEDKDPLLETNTKEGFLQISAGDTSVKAGIQILIWGESDGGAITDVISPRDYSELFFISLEESRIGQPMVVWDQFTDFGDWSLFYIPDPEFNELPEEGTAYYFDTFAGNAEFQDETSDEPMHEYGLRWKKTFGKSDVSLMMASLIENNYAYRKDGTTAGGKHLITKTKQRFAMTGVAFNYVTGNYLFKGELGRKAPQSFNDAAYQIVKRDVSDVALGLEYSPGGSYTLGMEAVNSHIHDWNEELVGTDENTRSLVISWSDTFLNEDLSIDWSTSYTEPRVAFFHSLRSSYKWNDHITYELEGFYPDIADEDNSYWIYRNEKRITLKAQLQF